MRAYSSAIVANALGVTRRWLDGVIVKNHIDGVRRQHQGVSRAISPHAVLTIAVSIELMVALHMPVAAALDLASLLVGQNGEHSPAPGVTVRVDVAALERTMMTRLTEAVDANPLPKRGRPRSADSGRHVND